MPKDDILEMVFYVGLFVEVGLLIWLTLIITTIKK